MIYRFFWILCKIVENLNINLSGKYTVYWIIENVGESQGNSMISYFYQSPLITGDKTL